MAGRRRTGSYITISLIKGVDGKPIDYMAQLKIVRRVPSKSLICFTCWLLRWTAKSSPRGTGHQLAVERANQPRQLETAISIPTARFGSILRGLALTEILTQIQAHRPRRSRWLPAFGELCLVVVVEEAGREAGGPSLFGSA